MKKLILVSVLFTFMLAPAAVLAMDHSKMEGMDHSKMEGMDHSGMNMQGDMMMLGSLVVEGVKAEAHLKDVGEAMAKMGMETTHHLMVTFAGEENGTAIDKGVVAVKVKGPDDQESKPVKLMGMGGHFGADLSLKKKGKYDFYIGTKLEDGEKRTYHFRTAVE